LRDSQKKKLLNYFGAKHGHPKTVQELLAAMEKVYGSAKNTSKALGISADCLRKWKHDLNIPVCSHGGARHFNGQHKKGVACRQGEPEAL
jgi:hypothetical protein